jgi:hypothetical protein
MTESRDSEAGFDFLDRFERLGRALGEREREHASELEAARAFAEKLRAAVASALDDFHRAAGSPQLAVDLSDVRPNEKHIRSVEFELSRGRHRALVTAKSKGEVTLVGPFQTGKDEGPCNRLPFDAGPKLRDALGDFLQQFLEAAAAP